MSFADGTPAEYGFGLNRRPALGRPASGHGGALRGWRSHRMYLPGERISVVVMFNHMADAHGAATDLLAACLGEDRPKSTSGLAAPDWLGHYVEAETGLAARIETASGGQLRLRWGHSPELLDLQADGSAANGGTTLRPRDGGVWMERAAEHIAVQLHPVPGDVPTDIAGRYRCAELEAEITVADAGGALYGGFSGFLGQGRMELLEPLGPDIWALPCPRALDHTPPGDWTLHFQRDGQGFVAGINVGCWLARNLTYARLA